MINSIESIKDKIDFLRPGGKFFSIFNQGDRYERSYKLFSTQSQSLWRMVGSKYFI